MSNNVNAKLMQEEDYQLIDQYLAGQLNEKEKEAVEARLESDPAFAEALQLEQEMALFLRQQPQRERLKEQFASLGEKYFTEASPARVEARILGLSRYQWLAAAGFALAVVAGALLFTQLQQSLYEQYNQHPPLALTEKASDGINLSQVEQSFNTGQYQEALNGLESYLAAHPDDLTAQLYKGIAALELKQYEVAIPIFEALRQSDSDIKDYGAWYLALTYLRQGDRARCRALLKQIPKSSELKGRAEALLEELG